MCEIKDERDSEAAVDSVPTQTEAAVDSLPIVVLDATTEKSSILGPHWASGGLRTFPAFRQQCKQHCKASGDRGIVPIVPESPFFHGKLQQPIRERASRFQALADGYARDRGDVPDRVMCSRMWVAVTIARVVVMSLLWPPWYELQRPQPLCALGAEIENKLTNKVKELGGQKSMDDLSILVTTALLFAENFALALDVPQILASLASLPA